MTVQYTRTFLIIIAFIGAVNTAQAQIGVWPGDANNDGIVNNLDLLNLGRAMNTQGPARTGVSIVWQEQQATTWNDRFPDSTNYAYADCDGDGQVTPTDTQAILQNYGSTHDSITTPPFLTGDSLTDPELYLATTTDTSTVANSFSMNITLGSPQIRVDSLYGIAFTVVYDPVLVEPGTMYAFFNSRWFGNPAGGDPIFISKNDSVNGKLHIAISQRGGTAGNAVGYGNIATLSFIIEDNLIGKTTVSRDFLFSFENIRFFDKAFSERAVYSKTDTITIDGLVSGINGPLNDTEVSIYPNPASGLINIHASGEQIVLATLYDITGKAITNANGAGERMNLAVEGIANGLYILQVQTAEGIITKKITIRN